MAKIYTAQEMRERAELVEQGFLDFPTGAMLRQAADLIEREERHEKKYEYAVKWPDGYICQPSDDISRQTEFLSFDRTRSVVKKLVRRPVGEWEEVKS